MINLKKGIKFSDLKFKKVPERGGFSSHTDINGFTLSIQASKFSYCSPKANLDSVDDYNEFEIAIWRKDDPVMNWRTSEFVDVHDDVAGYMSRSEINKVIQKLLDYKENKEN